MNDAMADVSRMLAAVSKLGRTQILVITGGVTALLVALVVWSQGNDGFVRSMFVGVAVVLFATTFALGGLACVLAIRNQDAQASQWSLKSLWFLLAGIAVVVIGSALA